jgi:phosphoglycerol transferase MdoB-like AlkP superfamily enzyme
MQLCIKQHLKDEEKKEVKAWYDNKNQETGPKYTNTMEGKNLIIVQLEAFQSFVLERKVNGQEITPNLNKLAKQSLVFDNYYYQTAWGGTSDAEFLSNISLLPARDGAVYYIYPGNTYDSMIKELEKKDYYTSVMHANRPGFWNRAAMYKNIGFDTYESEDQFNIDEVQCLGLSDKSFFRQAVDKMDKYDKPFYSFLITLSSHFPFKDSQNKLDNILDVGEFEGELMGDYLKAVKYTDEAIGEFIQDLKDKGLWDNSVVVFYGDHSAIPEDKKGQLARLLYGRDNMSDLEWFEAQKVVMMAHFPNEEIKGRSDITAGQMDLYPTIANLFGFDAKYSLGRDLLNSDDGFVVTRAGMWANNEVAYIKPIDKVLDLKTGEEKNREDYKAMFEKAQAYLKNSDAIIENDLICQFDKNNQHKNQKKN